MVWYGKITSNNLLSFNTGFILKSSCECQELKMVGKTSMALNPSNTRYLEQKLALKGLSIQCSDFNPQSGKDRVYYALLLLQYVSIKLSMWPF